MSWRETIAVTAAILGGVAAVGGFACALHLSDLRNERIAAEAKDAEWNGRCADYSVLLATTTGSPSFQACSNKRHKMHVTLASAPSNEEFGAVVFCECQR